jgi:putative ABC transport system permease protein
LPVLVSVLIEALALALIGAAAGALVAWILFNGHAFSSGGTFSQIAVKLHIGADLVATGIVWAAVIGLIGGILPAIRAARLPVAASLRAV